MDFHFTRNLAILALGQVTVQRLCAEPRRIVTLSKSVVHETLAIAAFEIFATTWHSKSQIAR